MKITLFSIHLVNDCGGTLYQPDSSVLNNIMSYGADACQLLITPGQAERIHNNIDLADPNNRAVKRALITTNDNFEYDLMIRDGYEDYGVEPNTVTDNFWTSPDIWVRVNDDEVDEHQNPVYSASSPNYIYVRVVNKGCSDSDGTGKIKLFWTKAGTNLPLQAWHGGVQINGVTMGGAVGEFDLPPMKSYEEKIFKFVWNVPNPQAYTSINEPWHFCLMAKIESSSDISAMPEITDTYYNFLNSNNLALKNVHVTEVNQNNSGKIHFSNLHGGVRNFRLKFKKELNYVDANIFNEAEVRLELDNKLFNIWQASNFSGSNYRRIGDRGVIINENTVLNFPNFTPNTIGLVNVKVNFLTTQYTSNLNYGFHIVHEDLNNNKVSGGEYFKVSKNERTVFNTNYTISNNLIQADQISEPATYNWYDSEGKLLHSGLSYLNDSNESVLLEITSLEDGFINYETINSENSNSSNLISSIYPNPASTTLNVNYNTIDCQNAYISIVKNGSSTYDNYMLNTNTNIVSIDVSSKPLGIYKLLLICNNQIIESHNL